MWWFRKIWRRLRKLPRLDVVLRRDGWYVIADGRLIGPHEEDDAHRIAGGIACSMSADSWFGW